MYIVENRVHLQDTDALGQLYYVNFFRFAQEAQEAFVAHEGFSYRDVLLNKPFFINIVHVEADYFAPVFLEEEIETHVTVSSLTHVTFTMHYDFYKKAGSRFGTAETKHVTLDKKNHQPTRLSDDLYNFMKKHLVPEAPPKTLPSLRPHARHSQKDRA